MLQFLWDCMGDRCELLEAGFIIKVDVAEQITSRICGGINFKLPMYEEFNPLYPGSYPFLFK